MECENFYNLKVVFVSHLKGEGLIVFLRLSFTFTLESEPRH